VKVISTPQPKHRCELPGRFAGMPSSPFDQHYEPVGTVIECEECGTRYLSRPWPDVRSGMQMVGNRWVRKVRPFWRRRRARSERG
jgi:hypothetical protein